MTATFHDYINIYGLLQFFFVFIGHVSCLNFFTNPWFIYKRERGEESAVDPRPEELLVLSIQTLGTK